MQISGRLTESVYRRYDIISRQDLATAAAKIEQYFKTSTLAPTGEGDDTGASRKYLN